MRKSQGDDKSFFSEDTYTRVESAFREKVSIENVPNIEFDEKRRIVLGNSNSPRLSNVRPRDINVTEINGITIVVAN